MAASRATELFAKITDDRYNSVSYDSEDNQLIVEKATGETLTPDQLSDGTRDQLYLAIRVALGEQILDGTPGFFVMDDAFLTSDATRIQEQAELVEELAEDGWQVVYLSSKDDAINSLKNYSSGEIEVILRIELLFK